MKQSRFDRIVIHCSATPPSMDIGVKEIHRWHKDRGFRSIGYHFVIRRNGQVESGRPYNEVPAAQKGFNRNSLAICLVGGVDDAGKPDDNFTDEQDRAWKRLVELALNEKLLPLSASFSEATGILGHRDLPDVAKACPSFDVYSKWIEDNGLSPDSTEQ